MHSLRGRDSGQGGFRPHCDTSLLAGEANAIQHAWKWATAAASGLGVEPTGRSGGEPGRRVRHLRGGGFHDVDPEPVASAGDGFGTGPQYGPSYPAGMFGLFWYSETGIMKQVALP
jgi:hypothetical protein